VVSLAAGVSTASLAQHLPAGTPVVRVMPNTPALVGQGMSVMSPGAGCPQQSLDLAEAVLGAVGQVRQVAEAHQDAVTALSGSGPAYVLYVVEAMIDAGVLLGLPRPLARDLAVQTVLGAATMVAGTGEHPTVLRENVTSPGGTTAAALHLLDEAAVKAAFARAMRAARDRSAELAGS
jgi:pyrroline-5-carboxylate reductase